MLGCWPCMGPGTQPPEAMLRETVAVCTEVPVKDWVSVRSIGYTALTPLFYLHWALSLAHTPHGTRVAVQSLGLTSGLSASRAGRMNACVGHGSVYFVTELELTNTETWIQILTVLPSCVAPTHCSLSPHGPHHVMLAQNGTRCPGAGWLLLGSASLHVMTPCRMDIGSQTALGPSHFIPQRPC